MARPKKFPDEVMQRAVRIALEGERIVWRAPIARHDITSRARDTPRRTGGDAPLGVAVASPEEGRA